MTREVVLFLLCVNILLCYSFDYYKYQNIYNNNYNTNRRRNSKSNEHGTTLSQWAINNHKMLRHWNPSFYQMRRNTENAYFNQRAPIRSLPIFEDEYSHNLEILRNNMYNHQRGNNSNFQMFEPVPGQIIYPPVMPRFKSVPKSRKLVSNSNESFQSRVGIAKSVQSKPRMLPFYAHEAISSPWSTLMSTTATTTSTPNRKPYFVDIASVPSKNYQMKPTQFPAVVYAKPYSQYQVNYRVAKVSSDPPNYQRSSIKPVYEEPEDAPVTQLPRNTTVASLRKQLLPPNDYRLNTTTPTTVYFKKNPNWSSVVFVTPLPNQKNHSQKTRTSQHAGFKTRQDLPIHTLANLLQNKNSKSHPENFTSTTTDKILNANLGLRGHQTIKPLSRALIRPNFNWVIMGTNQYRLRETTEIPGLIPTSPMKRSSSFRSNDLKATFRMSMPKLHKSKATLGTGILVQ